MNIRAANYWSSQSSPTKSGVYEVQWHDHAFCALQKLQERSNAVARAVFAVARTELPMHFPLDGGTGTPPLLWRRGITEQQRRALDATPRAADDGERACNYLLVYRTLLPVELEQDGGGGYMILDLLRDGDIAGAYLEIIAAARPTLIS